MFKDFLTAVVLSLWESSLRLRAKLGSKSAQKTLNYIAHQDASSDALKIGLVALDHQMSKQLCNLAGVNYEEIYDKCLRKRMVQNRRRSNLFLYIAIILILAGLYRLFF